MQITHIFQMKYFFIMLNITLQLIVLPSYGQGKTLDTLTSKQPYSVAFISFEGGLGAPMGMYQANGFAVPGVDYSFTAASTVDDSVFAWALKVNYAQNGVDGVALAKKLEQEIPLTFIPVSMGLYNYTTALIGAHICCRSTKRLGFNIKLLAGFMYAQSPVVIFHAYDSAGNKYTVFTQKYNTSGFCYEAGFGLNYNFTKHLCAFLDFDLMHGDPTPSGAIYGEDLHGAPVTTNIFGYPDSPHTVISIMAGVGFKIPGLHMYN